MKQFDYSVEVIDGVTIVRGSMPLLEMAALMAKQPAGCFLNGALSKVLGAAAAFGKPTDTEKLLRSHQTMAVGKRPRLPADAAEWLIKGEQGRSSLALFGAFFSYGASTVDHPHDPSDLRRCLLLLKQVPSIPNVEHMRSQSKEWDALADAWSGLTQTLAFECPNWEAGDGSAANTYAAMRRVLDQTGSNV